MIKIELENGKYTIIEDLDNREFKALRYGEDWRNLIGDNLILALVQKIEEMDAELTAKEFNHVLLLKTWMNKVNEELTKTNELIDKQKSGTYNDGFYNGYYKGLISSMIYFNNVEEKLKNEGK
jgi:hypothetical protein